jgi:hypothetical protein
MLIEFCEIDMSLLIDPKTVERRIFQKNRKNQYII